MRRKHDGQPMGELERAAKTPSFNLRHPEMKNAEVFLGNFSQEGFAGINFKDKRMGDQAFDHFGRKLPGNLRPVFIDREEYAPVERTVASMKRILAGDRGYQKDQREVWEEDRKRGQQ